MKPVLEELNIGANNRSLKFFKIEVDEFLPYWHYHPELELTFIYEGEGTRVVGDSIEFFSKSDLVLVGENIPHNWVSLNESKTKKRKAIVFQFRADVFRNFKECDHLLGLFKLASRGIHFRNTSPEIIDLIMNYEKLNKFDKIGALMKILDLLASHNDKICLTSQKYKPYKINKTGTDKFAKVNNYILEHLEDKITIAKMADYSNMVPQSFCRWFRQSSGYSFITFLNKARIEHACQMLLSDQKSIQEVAFSSGFESLSHFNRTFKKLKDKSPREYKKSNLKIFNS